MRTVFAAAAIAAFGCFTVPAVAALNPEPAPAAFVNASHPSQKYLNVSRVLPGIAGQPALDKLKRRVEPHGFLTVATAELGVKSDILGPQLTRMEIAESKIKAVNPAAATTLLIFASGCLMWLGLYEKRPY